MNDVLLCARGMESLFSPIRRFQLRDHQRLVVGNVVDTFHLLIETEVIFLLERRLELPPFRDA